MRAFALTCAILLVCGHAAYAAGSFDGTYHGSNTVSLNRGKACQSGFKFTINVVNDSFIWQLPAGGRVQVHVTPDGGFTAQNGRRFLSGRIADGVMRAHTTAERCEYDWSLQR